MSERIEFTVPYEPVPKGRPRVVVKNGRNVTYTPKRTVQAERSVAWHAKQAMAGRKPITNDVAVYLTFRRKTKRRCDIDNLVKLVLDAALNGIVIEDDAQVWFLQAEKLHEGEPSTRVLVVEKL